MIDFEDARAGDRWSPRSHSCAQITVQRVTVGEPNRDMTISAGGRKASSQVYPFGSLRESRHLHTATTRGMVMSSQELPASLQQLCRRDSL